ncbi:unnamed protein product [Choristocarpus tenellus]
MGTSYVEHHLPPQMGIYLSSTQPNFCSMKVLTPSYLTSSCTKCMLNSNLTFGGPTRYGPQCRFGFKRGNNSEINSRGTLCVWGNAVGLNYVVCTISLWHITSL